MKHSVSVIIPTYNRKKYVLRLLASLEKEKDISEVLIVSQGKRETYPTKTIYLSKPSMTHARNMGAQRAKGDLILFLDDDCIAGSGLASAIQRSFSDPKVAAVSGRVITPGQNSEPQHSGTGRVNWLGQVSGSYSSMIRQQIDTVIGCNMCWRKDVWKKLGGVDEKFTGNALREETDLSLRAKASGYKIVFDPEAEVTHDRAVSGGARKTEGRLQWYFDFFSNETYFFLKHRPKILLPLFLFTKIIWALRCMFGFGREVSVRSIVLPALGVRDGIRKYNS